MCFQELFYGPYFCQVQDPEYYAYTENIPNGPTTKRMQELAKETGMVLIVPMYEEDEHTNGIYYNTAAVIDADGTYLGKYRKTHIPHVKGFWEKFYFRPGNLGYPVFDTAVGKVGVYICYDRHFPEGARALGLNGAEMVFIPSATSRGLSEYLWRVEQVFHALANGYYVGTINRVGIEPDGRRRLLRAVLLRGPAGPVRGRRGRSARRGADRPRPGHGPDHRSPPALAVLPRPPAGRLRRPGRGLSRAGSDRQWTAQSRSATEGRAEEPPSPTAGLDPATLAAGQFLMTLDSSAMNVSIATVAEDVGTTITGIQTAITMYTLVMASLMIVGGKIGAVIGHRRAFSLGLVIYGLGSGSQPSHRTCRCSSSAGRCWRGSGPP